MNSKWSCLRLWNTYSIASKESHAESKRERRERGEREREREPAQHIEEDKEEEEEEDEERERERESASLLPPQGCVQSVRKKQSKEGRVASQSNDSNNHV